MRVLVISTDRKLLEKGSTVFERHVAYSRECDALDVIVLGAQGEQSEGALRVHGVGDSNRLLGGVSAWYIARKLQRPDVVTAQDPFENGLIALTIAKWHGARLHIQVHTDFLNPQFLRRSLINRLRRVIAGFVLPRATGVRVVSESIKESLQSNGFTLRASPSVLPIFVDIQKYTALPRIKHDRYKIALLWVGRLEKEKDPLFALQLLEIVRKMGHDAGLTIVGSGSGDGKLRDYVRERGLERFVDFKGWQEDLRPYFSAADILLVTSRYEGYGMAMIEALAAGVPVLSLDVGVARESGAIVVRTQKEMGRALLDWIAHGPRKGVLHSYPYTSRNEYVHAWCEDVRRSHLG